jgi:hypothetical protein
MGRFLIGPKGFKMFRETFGIEQLQLFHHNFCLPLILFQNWGLGVDCEGPEDQLQHVFENEDLKILWRNLSPIQGTSVSVNVLTY